MRGRLLVLVGVLGVVCLHQVAIILNWLQLLLLSLSGLFAFVLIKAKYLTLKTSLYYKIVYAVVALLLAFIIGFVYSAVSAKLRLDQQLATINVDKVSRVTLRVTGLPKIDADRLSFNAVVIDSHPLGVPKNIRVSWAGGAWRGPYAAATVVNFPEIYAGQIWRMALVLRPVSANQNLHGFDYEAYSFAANVRALGTVRGEPEFIGASHWHDLPTVANRARHLIRKAMAPYIEGLRYGPVLRALAIGDQDGVSDTDWQVFNRSGLTHLVSISGSHITMLAGAGAVLIFLLWCRLRWQGRYLAEYWPARRAAACVAMLIAWIYSLLAGWEVPAQRTFMMLAVVAIAQALQLRLSGSRVLALAAVVVIAFDPWAVMASGFWLSFAAVAVLLAVGASWQGQGLGTEQKHLYYRVFTGFKKAAYLQLAVTLALVPPLAWLFHEVSVVSPLANSYAIPGIELIVTPLSLLLAAVSLMPGAAVAAKYIALLAHGCLELIMWPTEWLASLPTINAAAAPAWLYLLASLGVGFALWPQKPRWWRLGWLAMLPMLLWQPNRPAKGEWHMYAIDIGQGSAILIQTSKHNFLFDAGPRHSRESDQGARTIVPLLKSLGVNKLDVLIASHVDLDHTGGIRSILNVVPVEQSYSSFDLSGWLKAEGKKLDEQQTYLPLAANYCVFGGQWHIDGVSFEFLWPLDIKAKRTAKEANAASCVLRVRGQYHSLLLTGDIDIKTEAALIDRGLAPVDIVIAAHHGSRTSSSASFASATAAKHVVMQVGRWNRHGHPHNAVLRTWADNKTSIWRTDKQGGVNAISRASGLKVYSVIDKQRRYWHGR